jgi:hypothetical protein
MFTDVFFGVLRANPISRKARSQYSLTPFKYVRQSLRDAVS